MSNIIATDLQKQEIDSGLVELFELVLPDDTTVYFHPGLESDLTEVVFDGNTYKGFPMVIDGLEIASDGAINRPNFSVANIGTLFDTELSGYKPKDLVGQRITRRQTLEKHLTSSPAVELRKVTYVIDRISQETNIAITFEVSAIYDLEGVNLPRRVTVGKYCSWLYQGHELHGKGGCTWREDSSHYEVRPQDDGTIRESSLFFDIDDHPLISNTWLTFSSVQNFSTQITDDSPTITVLTNVTITTGQYITATGVPTGTRVESVSTTDATEITADADATATTTDVSLTFTNVIDWDSSLTFDATSYVRTGTSPNYRYWLSKYDNNTNNDPTSTTYWTEVYSYTDHDTTNHDYSVGDLVKSDITVNGKTLTTIWYCTTAHNSDTAGTDPKNLSAYWRREEACGKRLSSCKCRFEARVLATELDNSVPTSRKNTSQPLPFGGFLGTEKI